MTNTSILTDNELNAVSGGDFAASWNIGGVRTSIPITDGVNGGQMLCVHVRTSTSSYGSCGIPAPK